jgi:uncharacterized membrane protein YoaK (UPF0700 family)
MTLVALLIAIAGFVDAIGYLTLGNLFVSFMSGNSTQFALGLGQLSAKLAWPAGALVALFVSGVVLGRLVAHATATWRREPILAVEALLLAAAALVPFSSVGQAALMTVAMGAQNATLLDGGKAKFNRTFVTGTLVNLGDALADTLCGSAPLSASAPYFLSWAGLVAGGAAGAVAYGRLGLAALVIPAFAVALLAAVLTREPDPKSA